MEKIKITAVSYLNTKPLLYGLVNSELEPMVDLRLEIPAKCAELLANKEVDLGLVPVAILPELESPHIVSDFCIGTDGVVASVCVFSEVPMEEVTHIYLDYQSRTSVELCKILMRDYWKVQPEILPTTSGFQQHIKGTTAGLVIGDRAIEMTEQYPYVYDLGEVWKQFTGLPFAFAVWVSHRPLDPTFVKLFNAALQSGIDHIPQLIYLLPTPIKGFDLKKYFEQNINYDFDEGKKKALRLFLNEIAPNIQASLEPALLV